MFSEETLLERLRRAGEPQERTVQQDRARLKRSILRNLENIVSSRQGHAPAQMDYGMPSPSEVANLFDDGPGGMRKVVKQCIEKYEPRLKDVQVIQVETEDTGRDLLFSIRAKLATSSDQSMVSFDTTVDSTGQIRIKG